MIWFVLLLFFFLCYQIWSLRRHLDIFQVFALILLAGILTALTALLFEVDNKPAQVRVSCDGTRCVVGEDFDG